MNPEAQRATEWFREISDTAGALGYGIVSISLARIELIHATRPTTTVILEGRFLSGAMLREILVPVPLEERHAP